MYSDHSDYDHHHHHHHYNNYPVIEIMPSGNQGRLATARGRPAPHTKQQRFKEAGS
jgi:hypothetical protein